MAASFESASTSNRPDNKQNQAGPSTSSHSDNEETQGPSTSGVLCPTCGIQLKTHETPRQHERVIHKGDAAYQCCGKLYKSKSCYTRHQCNQHGKKKEFHCETCNKTFAIKADLNRHVRRELGLLNFNCHMCTLKFETKKELMDHEGTHREQATNNQCRVCFKSFSFKSNMYRHNKLHNK